MHPRESKQSFEKSRQNILYRREQLSISQMPDLFSSRSRPKKRQRDFKHELPCNRE